MRSIHFGGGAVCALIGFGVAIYAQPYLASSSAVDTGVDGEVTICDGGRWHVRVVSNYFHPRMEWTCR